MEKRLCASCKKEMTGRIDRKFCSDECRTDYNNKINRRKSSALLKINKILRRNHKILEQTCAIEMTTCSFSYLIEQGFNFDYFTSAADSGRRGESMKMICYDYSYSLKKDGRVIIEKN